MIMPALLGAVILTDATQVCGRPRYPLAPTFDATVQPAQPMQNRAATGPWRVLTGIIAYTDPRQGFVMIGNSAQNTYLARPGDQLPDGSRIREIHPEHVVLEHEGSLETVGMYEHEQPTGTVYAPIPPPPLPQSRWDEEELKEATAVHPTPSQPPRPAEPPPGESRPSDTATSQVRSGDVRSIDAPPGDAPPQQAQPQAPSSPTLQDPADEFGDARRQHAASRRR